MRHVRLVSVGLLSAAILVGCTTAAPGWTYAPAPSLTPPPSGAASAGPSTPAASGGTAVVTITAFGIKYTQATVTAPAGKPFQIKFENNDPGTPHNVSIHLGGATGAELFKGPVFNGVETRTYDVPALDAGAYAFVCTVHPTMVGTLNAQ